MLEVTALPELSTVTQRWTVYHRWTQQHIVAAADLVYGERGTAQDRRRARPRRGAAARRIRFAPTAVQDLDSPDLAPIRDAQVVWLQACDKNLQLLAAKRGLGASVVLGSTPMDPVLQWQEQLITDDDVSATKIANVATRDAFADLARRLTEDTAWEGL